MSIERRVRQFWRTRSCDFAKEYTSAFVADRKQTKTDQTLQRAVFLDQDAFRALLAVGQILNRNTNLSFAHTPVDKIAAYFRTLLRAEANEEEEEEQDRSVYVPHATAMDRRARQKARMLAGVKHTSIRVAAMAANGAIQSFDPSKLPGSGRLASEPSLSLMFHSPQKRQQQQQTSWPALSKKEKETCRGFLSDWSRYKRFVMGMHQRRTWAAVTQQLDDPVRAQLRALTLNKLTQNWLWLQGDLHLIRSGAVSFLYLGITQRSFVDGTACVVQEELERGVSAQLVAKGQKQAVEMWKTALGQSVAVQARRAFGVWTSSGAQHMVALLRKLQEVASKHVQSRLSIRKAITESAPSWACLSKHLTSFYHQHLDPIVVLQKAQADRLILFEMLYRSDPDPFEDSEYMYDDNKKEEAATETAWSGTIEPYPISAPKAIGASDNWCSNQALQKTLRRCIQEIHDVTVMEILNDVLTLARRLCWLLRLNQSSDQHLVDRLTQKIEARYGTDLGSVIKEGQSRVSSFMEHVVKCQERWAWQQHERLASEIRNHKDLEEVMRAVRCRFDARCDLMLNEINHAPVDSFFQTFVVEWGNIMSHITQVQPFEEEAALLVPDAATTLRWSGQNARWIHGLCQQLDAAYAETTRALAQLGTKWPLAPPALPNLTREPVLVSDVLTMMWQSQVYASVLDQVIQAVRRQ